MLNLLARFRRTSRPTEPRPDDHVAAAVSPPKPDEGPRPAPAPSAPPEPSPPRAVGPVWPSPRTWLTATVTEVDRAREDRVLARLAQLTDELDSPLAAAQHRFAPNLRKDTRA